MVIDQSNNSMVDGLFAQIPVGDMGQFIIRGRMRQAVMERKAASRLLNKRVLI